MTGRSFLDVLKSAKSGVVDPSRNLMLVAKERHDLGRPNNAGYPVRAIRTPEFLYVRNYEPESWPAGNPETGYRNAFAQADVTLDLFNEIAAVGGLAHGAGGHRGDAADALTLGEGAERRQGSHARVDGLRRQASLAERATAEAHHLFGTVEHAEAAIRLNLRHDHVDGIAADVDSRDSHVPPCYRLHRLIPHHSADAEL